jgi:hypothetical protein
VTAFGLEAGEVVLASNGFVFLPTVETLLPSEGFCFTVLSRNVLCGTLGLGASIVAVSSLTCWWRTVYGYGSDRAGGVGKLRTDRGRDLSVKAGALEGSRIGADRLFDGEFDIGDRFCGCY